MQADPGKASRHPENVAIAGFLPVLAQEAVLRPVMQAALLAETAFGDDSR